MATTSDPFASIPPKEWRRIMKRAGVDPDRTITGMCRGPADLDSLFRFGPRAVVPPEERALVELVRALLVDAVREDERWARRVKLLERRADFAVEALRGGGDDDL